MPRCVELQHAVEKRCRRIEAYGNKDTVDFLLTRRSGFPVTETNRANALVAKDFFDQRVICDGDIGRGADPDTQVLLGPRRFATMENRHLRGVT